MAISLLLCSVEIAAKGDEYQVFRKDAKQHWNSMKSCYQKVNTVLVVFMIFGWH